MKAVVAAFNQEKALVGAFSVITNLRMELFGALLLSEYGEAKWRLVDSVLVTSASMRLSPILWWLATQAPQVHLVHLVRNPRGVLAEMMATARLRGTPLAEEEVRSQLADLCQDLRDDLAAAGNLHHSRYTRIK